MADETTTTPPAAPPPEKTFTQADLDRILKERLDRERAKYQDYDDLKTKASKLSQIEDSQKTEAQKLADRLGEIEKQLGLKDKAIGELTTALSGERRANLAASVASRLGAHDPADANVLAAISSIDPAGANAEREIEAALTELQKRKPYLFRAPGQGRTEPFNPAGTSGVAETDQQRVKRIYSQAGMLNYGPLGKG